MIHCINSTYDCHPTGVILLLCICVEQPAHHTFWLSVYEAGTRRWCRDTKWVIISPWICRWLVPNIRISKALVSHFDRVRTGPWPCEFSRALNKFRRSQHWSSLQSLRANFVGSIGLLGKIYQRPNEIFWVIGLICSWQPPLKPRDLGCQSYIFFMSLGDLFDIICVFFRTQICPRVRLTVVILQWSRGMGFSMPGPHRPFAIREYGR